MHLLARLSLATLLVLPAACGGGSAGGTGSAALPVPSLGPGTTVNVTFVGALPNAAAVSIAGGIFVPSTLSRGTLSFLVPAGTNTYAFAVACPAAEHVYEANLSDGSSYSIAPCNTAPSATGSATGTFDATSIPSAVRVRVVGAYGYSGDVNGSTGAFNVVMPSGMNDVAVLALDGVGNVLAVKMLRSQAVPGAVNAGATIVVSAIDAVTPESVTFAGVPPGFSSQSLDVSYLTANGTIVMLSNGSRGQYPAISFADLAATDQYQIASNATSAALNESIGTASYSITGSPVTLTYPSPWTYTPPAAAQFPTFSYAYSGFTGSPTQTYLAQIAWQLSAGATRSVTVHATAAYLGIQTSIAMPNLTTVPGFFGSAPSGTPVTWLSQIDGATFVSFVYPPPVPGSLSYVLARGAYTQP